MRSRQKYVHEAELLQRLEELSARFDALEKENVRLREENQQLRQENQLLRQKLERFIRHYFGGPPRAIGLIKDLMLKRGI